ncbi:MAG: hypothetical protein KatS3mg082_2775 [Nitrospiraceae bacterium]|nr:MAG: hypothetical protein KatS3mg082_2775 [Nitrospiraceae bacterium]
MARFLDSPTSPSSTLITSSPSNISGRLAETRSVSGVGAIEHHDDLGPQPMVSRHQTGARQGIPRLLEQHPFRMGREYNAGIEHYGHRSRKNCWGHVRYSRTDTGFKIHFRSPSQICLGPRTIKDDAWYISWRSRTEVQLRCHSHHSRHHLDDIPGHSNRCPLPIFMAPSAGEAIAIATARATSVTYT